MQNARMLMPMQGLGPIAVAVAGDRLPTTQSHARITTSAGRLLSATSADCLLLTDDTDDKVKRREEGRELGEGKRLHI